MSSLLCDTLPSWRSSCFCFFSYFICAVKRADLWIFSDCKCVSKHSNKTHTRLQTYTYIHHYPLPFWLLSVILSCRLKDLFPLQQHSRIPISVTCLGTRLPRSRHNICGSKMFCHSFILQTLAVAAAYWAMPSWDPGGIKNVFNPNGRALEACQQCNYMRWRQLSPSKVFTSTLWMSADVIMAENQVLPNSDAPTWEEICSHDKIIAVK